MKGFTLVELMATILLAVIISSIGIPSMFNLYDRHKTSTEIRHFKQMLERSRLLSINSTQFITICPMISLQCSSNWSLPFTIFADLNNNLMVDHNESIIMQFEQPQEGQWITRNNISTGIEFTPDGHAYGSASTLVYCPNSRNYEHARQLIISFQGRIRINEYLSSTGVPYRSLGSLICS